MDTGIIIINIKNYVSFFDNNITAFIVYLLVILHLMFKMCKRLVNTAEKYYNRLTSVLFNQINVSNV